MFHVAGALPLAGDIEDNVPPSAPSRRVVAALACVLALTASSAARAQGDPYKRHMDNGVRLYTDRNYAAAVVEFQAAYDARPSAKTTRPASVSARPMKRLSRCRGSRPQAEV